MAKARKSHRLAGISLFRGLSSEELAGLDELLREKSYPAKTTVLLADQPGEAVYFIVSGRIRVYLEQSDGSEMTVAFLGAGDVMGEMSLVDESSRSASAVTVEPSILLSMDRSAFRNCLRVFPTLTYNLVRGLTVRLRRANEKILALSTLDVTGRVAHHILALADQYGEADEEGNLRILFPLTQAEIAEIAGASRERVNRVMVSLRESGAVTVGKDHHVTVVDHEKLLNLCR